MTGEFRLSRPPGGNGWESGTRSSHAGAFAQGRCMRLLQGCRSQFILTTACSPRRKMAGNPPTPERERTRLDREMHRPATRDAPSRY